MEQVSSESKNILAYNCSFLTKAAIVVCAAVPLITAAGAALVSFKLNVLKKHTFLKIFFPILVFTVTIFVESGIVAGVVLIRKKRKQDGSVMGPSSHELIPEPSLDFSNFPFLSLLRNIKTVIFEENLIYSSSWMNFLQVFGNMRKQNFSKIFVRDEGFFSDSKIRSYPFEGQMLPGRELNSLDHLEGKWKKFYREVFNFFEKHKILQMCSYEEFDKLCGSQENFLDIVVLDGKAFKLEKTMRIEKKLIIRLLCFLKGRYKNESLVQKELEKIFWPCLKNLLKDFVKKGHIIRDWVLKDIRNFLYEGIGACFFDGTLFNITELFTQQEDKLFRVETDELFEKQLAIIKWLEKKNLLRWSNENPCGESHYTIDTFAYDNKGYYIWDMTEEERQFYSPVGSPPILHPFNARLFEALEEFLEKEEASET